MRKHSIRLSGLVAGLAITVAACGGDPTGTNSGDALTALEVQAVFGALGTAFDSAGAASFQRVSVLTSTGASPDLAVVPVNESFNVTVPCESGSIQLNGSINGTIDDQTFATDLSMDFTFDMNACVVSTAATSFTLNGDPEIQFKGNMTFSSTQLTFSGTEKGGFSFTASDCRAGSCAVDVTFNSTVNLANGTEQTTITGTICGLSAAEIQVIIS